MSSTPKTHQEWVSATENARRQARFRAAETRIKKIVETAPPLTEEQRRRLALLLSGGDAA